MTASTSFAPFNYTSLQMVAFTKTTNHTSDDKRAYEISGLNYPSLCWLGLDWAGLYRAAPLFEPDPKNNKLDFDPDLGLIFF